MGWTGSEWLLWGGIGLMAFSVLGSVFCLLFFGITGKRLKKKLELDYGNLKK